MTIIIGAGLSGLLTAYFLKQAGLPFVILEARDRIGGRIHTIDDTKRAPLEMGATWFTHQHHQMLNLLKELKIEYFEQNMDTTVFYESSPNSGTQLVRIPSSTPSYRISGGSSKLVNKLLTSLDKIDIYMDQTVKQIQITQDTVQVYADQVWSGDRVVLSLPPKLWAKHILFDPVLPRDLVEIALQTQTWMENAIKVALTYDQPFWKAANLPTTLFSNVGPIIELYDHSNNEQSKYALCGFVNSNFGQLSKADRYASIIKQLSHVFGEQALTFSSYEECVWSQERYTCILEDHLLSPHQNNGNPIFTNTIFEDKVMISGSETAREFPGYMEGAIDAARRTSESIIGKINRNKQEI